MTQYFLTVPHDTATEPTMASMQEFDPEDLAAVMAAVDEFNTALKASGAYVFAAGLNPPSTAKTVDVSSGATQVLDEPFVEAESYVGGFWVIEAADEDAAIEWAVKASTALQGRIEVRAVQQEPETAA
ncbi:YciI family protein [Microbacterium sp. NPDC058345]|uniref:YciI family protein n=1 Tax=Microbacterium sp. NPDC058345 TaxID=3346455 RepID=UPI00366932C3